MKLSRKVAVTAGVVASGLAASVAFAFWSATGTGTGTGTVASGNGSVSLSAEVAPGIYPGGTAEVTITATNAGSQAVAPGLISLSGVTSDIDHASCDTTAFTMVDVDASSESVPAAADATHPGTLELTHKGTLAMANTAVNQDACKGATLALDLSSTQQ
jgi:hypothetical protein